MCVYRRMFVCANAYVCVFVCAKVKVDYFEYIQTLFRQNEIQMNDAIFG